MTACSDCEHNLASGGEKVAVAVESYPVIDLEDALALDASVVKIAGASGTGKTEYLIRKTAALLSSGVSPESICVVVATADARKAFEARLRTICGQTCGVKITTIMQVCSDVLGTPEAIAATGRKPRLLNNAEYKFVLEDIKTLGQQPSRLKRMLNYFYFQWSQLEPEEEWLLPSEEAGVRHALARHLDMRNALLREELSPLCVAYLRREDGGAKTSFDYVLVDDYQNLSKASQAVCALLSSQCLFVTGNENQVVEGFDPYPFSEGFSCFEHHHEGALCFQLEANLRSPQAVAAMGNALCRQGDQSSGRLVAIDALSDTRSITQIKWSSPEEELTGLPRVIKSLFSRDPKLDARDVYVVAPNKTWAHTLGRKLAKLGIQSTTLLDAQALGGDPRDFERAASLLAYTKLNLLAQPHDVVAWRSWCGFGDYLCYSGAWTRLETWAEEQGLALLDALSALDERSDEPFLEACVMRERLRSGRAAIEALSGKQGFALMRALVDEQGSQGFSDLLEPFCGDEDATTLYSQLSSYVLESSFEDTTTKVRIGSYKRLQGLSPKVLVVSGLIDGFMPSRNCFDVALLDKEREKELAICRRVFYNAITKPSERLILSTLQKVELEMAETMKMEVRRVKMERGQRLAMLSPSVFIEEAGDAVPGALSGEQYLSEL